MTRTIASLDAHHHEEEDDDADDVAAGTDTSSHREGKSAEQKPNNNKHRSKHSETEQRRRSKINERFQILRDLIPPNDQKRDKASLLLEVIEYVQFLQEKLQVYEGSYQQVWNQEPTKLMPWSASHGPIDNFVNHSEVMKNGSLDENNMIQPMIGTQGSMETEFSEDFAYKGADHPTGPTLHAAAFNASLQPCSYSTGSILPIDNLPSQPHLLSILEGAVIGNEGRGFESSSTSVSNVYSQGVLRKLTQALQTSGVDLSQTNISVQLDVGKREDNGSITGAASSAGVVSNRPRNSQLGKHSVDVSDMGSVQAVKRLRPGGS